MKTNDHFSMRAATLADIPVLREFEQGVVNAERAFTDRLVDGKIQYYDLPELIENKEAEVLIASADGSAIGCGLARIERDKPHFTPNTYAYLGCMYVTPQWRGRGVIQGLITELFDWSRSRNIEAFKLDVFARNQAAIRAYEKLGFQSEMIQMVKR